MLNNHGSEDPDYSPVDPVIDTAESLEYPITKVMPKKLPFVTPPPPSAANSQSGSIDSILSNQASILDRRHRLTGIMVRVGLGVLLAATVAVGTILMLD